jgi:histidine ammonia-lyase
MPQIMGGVLDQLAQAARVLACEIAGVSDNPLIDPGGTRSSMAATSTPSRSR